MRAAEAGWLTKAAGSRSSREAMAKGPVQLGAGSTEGGACPLSDHPHPACIVTPRALYPLHFAQWDGELGGAEGTIEADGEEDGGGGQAA